MIRPFFAIASLALGATAVMAQQSIIETRQNLMKDNSAQARVGAAMAKGEAPFDLAKAKQIFVSFQEKANRLPSLFPPDSRTGQTRASPKIWEDTAGFQAAAAKFGAEAKAAEAAVKDLDSFRKQFGEVTKNCGSCHGAYRQSRS